MRFLIASGVEPGDFHNVISFQKVAGFS
jgi:hypothetical protein